MRFVNPGYDPRFLFLEFTVAFLRRSPAIEGSPYGFSAVLPAEPHLWNRKFSLRFAR